MCTNIVLNIVLYSIEPLDFDELTRIQPSQEMFRNDLINMVVFQSSFFFYLSGEQEVLFFTC